MNVIIYNDWTFVQVTKEAAQTAFNRGSQVAMCPNKSNLFSESAPTTLVSRKGLESMNKRNGTKTDFFAFCAMISKATCSREGGARLNYYIRAKVTNLK